MKKVYGGCFMFLGTQRRGIFCGTQREVAEAVGCSVGYIRDYWCATGNKKEIEIATSKPNTLFWCENTHKSLMADYFEVETGNKYLDSESK